MANKMETFRKLLLALYI